MRVRVRRRRAAGAAVAFLVLGGFLLANRADASPYPTVPYGDTTGTAICDVTGEINPSHSDVACSTTQNASAFIGSDGVTATFGILLAEDPRTSTQQGPLQSSAYVVAIAANGVQVATAGVDGKQTAGDDFVYVKCFDETPTYNVTVNDAISAGTMQIFAEPSSPPYYRVEFQVPLSALQPCGVTASSPVQLFYGSSQAANLDVINKDYFRGSSVDFTGLAIITFGGSLSVEKTSSIVGGPNPPQVLQTTTYDLTVTVYNQGVASLTAMTVTDAIPAGVSIVSLSASEGTASASGQSITWDGLALGPGEVRTLTIRVSVTPASSQVGSPIELNPGATATATEWDGSTVSASSGPVSSSSVVGPALAASKTVSPASINVGQDTTYTITLSNTGTAAATVTSVTDDLPAGMSYVGASTAGTLGAGEPAVDGQSLTWTGSFSVPAGESRTITFDATATQAGQLSNVAGAEGSNFSTVSTGPTAELDVNGPPTALDDNVSVAQDGSVAVAVLTNDSAPDGEEIVLGSISDPANGTAVANPDGTITYTPDPGYSGPETFTYQACDADGACSTATVSVTVYAPNGPPIVLDDAVPTNEDDPVNVAVLDNDTDPQGGTLTVTSATDPASGSVVVESDGTVTYTPDANYNGPDSFTYEACNEADVCDTATVDITVIGVNDEPVATDDGGATDEDEPVTIDVLANDSDVDGESLSVGSVSDPANGTVTVNLDGTVTYTPDPGFNGPDTFTYEACDGSAACDTATVTVTVGAVNDPPVVADDTTVTGEDGPLNIAVLVNDSDPDGDDLEITSASDPAHGSVTVNADGTITYTPDAEYNGPDSFTYDACDPSGACDTATVNLTVLAVNDPPVVADDTASTGEDEPVGIDVLANDDDLDGDSLSVASVSAPAHGTAVAEADGTVTYTPEAGYNGPDSFTYEACDTAGACDSAEVTITVSAVNDASVANDDVATTDEDAPVTIDVLANDSDPDGDELSVSSVTQPEHGSVVVEADGTVTYTPDADYNGPDSFTYEACDPSDSCAMATVDVTVTPVNDPPAAVDDVSTTAEDASASVTIKVNDSDPEGDDLDVSLVTEPEHGVAEVAPDGTITYTPDPDYDGVDTFTYQVCDDSGACSTATVNITVVGVNDPPVAADDAATTAQDKAADVTVLSNDSDPEGNALAVVLTSQPTYGTAAVNDDGSVTYSPDAGYGGDDRFTYLACDGDGECAAAGVTVEVMPITVEQDEPVADVEPPAPQPVLPSTGAELLKLFALGMLLVASGLVASARARGAKT